MTGAQHAARAEELLAKAEELLDGPRCHHARDYAMTANAHATLALRAAVYHAAKGTVLAAAAPEPDPVEEEARLRRPVTARSWWRP